MDTGKNQSRLRSHLLSQCDAMVKYALSDGKQVPVSIIQTLEACGQLGPEGEATDSAESVDVPETRGVRTDTGHLAIVHGQLSELVSPARPQTILLLRREARKGSWIGALGPVSLIRRMVLVSILSLLGLVGFSLFKEVNGDPKDFSLFLNSGWSLLVNELFLLSAAAVGASFAGLFQANRYIRDGTFDPKFESTYWIRFILGIIAGTILAWIIPLDAFEAASAGGETATSVSHGLGKPLLSLLGGFSAAVVYRVLNRIVSAVESLVRGDLRDRVAATEQATQARFAQQSLRDRIGLLGQLKKLEELVDSSSNPQDLKAELSQVRRNLFPTLMAHSGEEGARARSPQS